MFRDDAARCIWDEYIGLHPDGYRYSRYCDLYRAWALKLPVTMRQDHAAGEKLFVDYAGDTVTVVIDRLSGKTRQAHLFVAVLGASSLSFAHARWSETLPDWIECLCLRFEAFGGALALLISDNAKVAGIKACHFDPQVIAPMPGWRLTTAALFFRRDLADTAKVANDHALTAVTESSHISVLAEISGSSAAAMADTLRSKRIEIEVCEGTLPERNYAAQTVRRFLKKGIVLDTLTHWAAVKIGAVPILKEIFGRVLVPHSTLDELVKLQDDDTEVVVGSEMTGTAFYHGGKFYYDEMTPERRAVRTAAIQARMDSLNSECEVVPVHAPEDADPEIMERLNGGSLDPIFVAREHGVMLLSEGKRYRIWAASSRFREHGCKLY